MASYNEVAIATEYARLALQVSWSLFPTHPLQLTDEERRRVDEFTTLLLVQGLWWTRSAAFAACLATPGPPELAPAERPAEDKPTPAPDASRPPTDSAPPRGYLYL